MLGSSGPASPLAQGTWNPIMPARLIRNLLGILCLAALIAAGLLPAARADDLVSATLDYRDATLENGLRVLSIEDHSTPVVAVQLWYHVGSKDEDQARQGFAHMFEHMMFRGTDRLGSKDHFDLIRRTGGWCNAYTNFDQTVYVETLPANQLELAFWLEAERMGFLKIDQASFDTERKVVEEERRLGLNQPYGTAVEKVLPEIFGVHPYRWSPIGKIPHLRAASAQELRDFWTKYYVPNNATLIVVGDVEHAQVQALAARYFGWIPRAPDPPRISSELLPAAVAKTITLKEENAPVPGVGVGFRTVSSRHPDFAKLELLSSILGGGTSSRLHRRLVAETQQAAVVASMAMSLEQEGIFAAGALLPPFGGKPDEVRAVLDQELARLRDEPVSERELMKAKNQRLKGLIESLPLVGTKAQRLGTAAVLEQDASRIRRLIEEVRDTTAADLQQVARTYLTPERAIAVRIERNLLGSLLRKRNPEEDAKVTAEPELATPQPGRPGLVRPADFPARPPIAPAVPFDPTPRFVEHRLANGLRVVVIEDHEVPTVHATLHNSAGAWTEAKPGTATMAASLITHGTRHRTEAEIADQAETYAISLGGGASIDVTSVSLGCLTEHLDRGFDLLGDVVLAPTFPDAELEKRIREVRTALALSEAQAEYQAERQLRLGLFGDHPYARTATGESHDLDALDAEELKQWWARYIRPDMATLYISGDVKPDHALALAERTFGPWSAQGPKPESRLPDPPQIDRTRIYLVDRPGVQSQIRVGQLAPSRRDPEYFKSRVVSNYFGGEFTSRLNETIRVKRGLTYGANGGFAPDRFLGSFRASTFSKTDSTAEALRAVLEEIERLRTEPPSAEELDAVKTSLVGGLALQRESPQSQAADLMTLEENDLPLDHFATLVQSVVSATPAACLDYAHQMINPDRLVIVVVGDAAALETELQTIAPVTVVAPRDR
jgi:zinc protease